jgi:hypothetical protein
VVVFVQHTRSHRIIVHTDDEVRVSITGVEVFGGWLGEWLVEPDAVPDLRLV